MSQETSRSVVSQETIGVLGGSFNPPHIAHVMLALYGLSVGQLSRVIVAPTFQHAFDKPLQAFEHRLRMCELSFSPLHNVEVSDIERELGGVSRTLRLVQTLAARHPHASLRLLVGSDILAERQRWQHFDRICELAPPLVAARLGHQHVEASAPSLLPQISSSELRAALSNNHDVSAYLPHSVVTYIHAHSLYAGVP